MYDMLYDHQTLHRNQHSYTQNGLSMYTPNTSNIYGDQGDNWIFESRTMNEMSKALKVQDRMETIEITSKDLSPASFASNLDLLLPEFCKNAKDYKAQDSQWYYDQKYNEYPSCAQYNNHDAINKTAVKYCSIQKQNGNCNNYSYGNDLSTFHHMQPYNKKGFVQEMPNYSTFNNFERLQEMNGVNLQNEFYSHNNFLCTDNLQFAQLQDLEQHSEVSQESDIIVEESEGEVTNCTTDLGKLQNTTCTVCNTLYSPIVSQFYILTGDSPLTMSSQKPVLTKLTEIVGKISKFCYLCSCCLELINTIDHLQFNLESSKYELLHKFKVCNNVVNVTVSNNQVLNKNVKFKDVCKHSFNCKVCKKTFSIKTIHRCHMKKHKLNNIYLCEICGKRFKKFSKLLIHIKTHKLQDNLKGKINAYLCKFCRKSFRTRTNLREHENYCSGILPYICKYPMCNKKFATNAKLKSHVKLKHDKKFSSICSICNIGFTKLSDHKSHMISHSTVKKFPCSLCDKTYKTLSNLNFHMKIHDTKLPYICEICNKGFMRKEYLESHLNLHKGVKNYACHMCDKKFVSQKYLDAHLRYHDGTVKRKTCNICGKSVTTGLEDHIRSHNNLREFNCDKCGMQFNTKRALAKHVKKKQKCS